MNDAEVTIERHPSRRGVYRLKTAMVLPANIEQVFAFFAAAENLEAITPPWLKFKIVTPGPLHLQQGSLIDYRLRLRGVPIRWQSEIAVWEPPHRFVDRQVRGPYLLWHHEHRFSSHAQGTLCEDEVDYAVPGGRLVHQLLVRRDLLKIFAYRAQRLREEFRR
jgi:ligand-binding SRPBCC domain-containing protein